MSANTGFERLRGLVAPLLRDNIDTDQIIPARFLKVTDRASLGAACFADWRRDGSFVLEQEPFCEAQILLVGENFGCGSSREHAAWALRGAGFRAVIARSFGDIFRQNALKNGLLPIVLAPHDHALLVTEITGEGAAMAQELEVDLERQLVISVAGHELGFEIDPFSRHCLLAGIDELDYLLGCSEQVACHEVDHE